MNIPGQGPDDTQALRARLSRYSDGGLIPKAGMRLTREALTPEDLELLRRRDIRVHGRVCEDVIRAVNESEPSWTLLAENGLLEDLTVSELNAISHALRGGPTEPGTWANPVSASLLFTDPANLFTLRQIIPGDLEPQQVTGYRYACLVTRDFGNPEPLSSPLLPSPINRGSGFPEIEGRRSQAPKPQCHKGNRVNSASGRRPGNHDHRHSAGASSYSMRFT